MRMEIHVKQPGLDMDTRMMQMNASFLKTDEQTLDAYETLLLDVIEGDRSLFLRFDEVEWGVARGRSDTQALDRRARLHSDLCGGQLGAGGFQPPVRQRRPDLAQRAVNLPEWRVFADADALVAELSAALCAEAAAAIAARGAFHLVLAGGTTPLALYRALARQQAGDVRWHVWYGDERCLPVDHPSATAWRSKPPGWLRRASRLKTAGRFR